MLLIYNDPAKEPAYGTPDFEAMMGGCFAANERMKEDGVLRSGEGLKGIDTATTQRIRAGKVKNMDGTMAETRKHLGGCYVIDVTDLGAALTYAALIPAASSARSRSAR